MAITFNFENDFKLKKKKVLKHWLKEIAKKYNRKIGELNYIFCDDEYLLNINNKYLQHDFYTDIITFDNSVSELLIEGDIYISTDRVHENAIEFNKPKDEELARVLAHGLLHLIGYKDKTEEEITEMRLAEEDALKMLVAIILELE